MATATVALATTAMLAACSSDSGDGESSESASEATSESSDAESEDGEGAGDEVFIGITQIVEHASLDASVDGFKQALKDAGLNVNYDEQNAQGDQATAATIAGNFADANLDLVLAVATPTAQAAAQAITDTPVLFTAVTDPVGAQLVDSLEAPGANLTGTTDANPVADQLELLKQIVPDAVTVGIVYSSGESNSEVQVEWAKEAAPNLGLEIVEATVTTSAEVQQAAESLDVDAYYVITDNTVVSGLGALIQVAENNQIPVIAAEGDSVANGAIATYGISYYDLGYQTGEMALSILNDGADPATMPVEALDELTLYLNLAAAERMGVEIPQDLIDEADPENITE